TSPQRRTQPTTPRRAHGHFWDEPFWHGGRGPGNALAWAFDRGGCWGLDSQGEFSMLERSAWRGAIALSVTLIASVLLPMESAMPANGAETSPRPAAASWSGCQTQGNFETCHTDPPGSGGEDTTIVDRLGQLVQSTNAGDTIRIAMFTWSRKRLATDVIEAKKRGVDVRVVFDQKGGGAEPAEMMKA